MKDIYLVIDTTKGSITIPFLGIKELDEFTIRYDNQDELVKNLFKILGIKSEPNKVRDVYVFKEYRNKSTGKCYTGHLPVKYGVDNYKKEDIFYALASYLKDDPRRIRRTDVQYVKHDALMDYLAGERQITDFDIERAVSSHLDSHGYMAHRNAYFIIKNHNYQNKDNTYKIRIEKVEKIPNTDKMSSFQTKDPYFSYLQEYAKKGEEEYDKAMDMIASYSLEELRNLKSSLGEGIVDGVNDELAISQDEVYTLEMLTGMSNQALMNLVNNYSKKGNGRR